MKDDPAYTAYSLYEVRWDYENKGSGEVTTRVRQCILRKTTHTTWPSKTSGLCQLFAGTCLISPRRHEIGCERNAGGDCEPACQGGIHCASRVASC